MFQSIIKWPKLILSVIYEKVSEQAKKANISVKDYVGNDKNIDHISAVVYDILPLPIKIGLRHEEFNKSFHKHFKAFRNKLYSYEDSLSQNGTEKNNDSQNKEIKVETKITEDVAKTVKRRVSAGKAKIIKLNDKVEDNKNPVKKTPAKKKPSKKKEAPVEQKLEVVTTTRKKKKKDE